MNTRPAPRSIADYLEQLRQCLEGEDPALIQDAAYDAEEYLRAELAAHKDKSEADVLELIASTYGAPEEVAAAYRDTEAKVRAALRTPSRPAGTAARGPLARFFGVFSDPRAYMSLFFLFLAFGTGLAYFIIAVVGLSLSAGLAILIIGVPFFLAFIALLRMLSLVEGRVIEGLLGERMPRRPVHPGPARTFFQRIGDMLRDSRTWTTLAYFVMMLPLGISYFVIALVGLLFSVVFTAGPLVEAANKLGLTSADFHLATDFEHHVQPDWLGQLASNPAGLALMFVLGVLLLTCLLHLARTIGRWHGRFAKAMLVAR
jgi:hypothetical protein